MRIIDAYYIKNGKCIKIHGVGIAYNVARGMLYCKAITLASGVLCVSPIALMIGIGVCKGFVDAAKQQYNTVQDTIAIAN